MLRTMMGIGAAAIVTTVLFMAPALADEKKGDGAVVDLANSAITDFSARRHRRHYRRYYRGYRYYRPYGYYQPYYYRPYYYRPYGYYPYGYGGYPYGYGSGFSFGFRF